MYKHLFIRKEKSRFFYTFKEGRLKTTGHTIELLSGKAGLFNVLVTELGD